MCTCVVKMGGFEGQALHNHMQFIFKVLYRSNINYADLINKLKVKL